ncbi:glutamate receptor 3.7 [Typha latifolia]|uniref:glutamate receptor 3.7 n=1 Tax=Typha latifolia TaxID=4733 RepID=UPI003C306939
MAPLFVLVLLCFNGLIHCERPAVVNIGAVLTYDSLIGGVAKVAIEAAVDDINADTTVLAGTQLNLLMHDSNCSAFLGSVGAWRAFEENAVAIIGPQSSTIARMISSIANGLQVPLISFAATDPTLSSLEFPFFLRMTPSDSSQMVAMADLIYYYGWRQVIAIFVDDDYGRNGINSLDDELATKMSKIYKIGLPVGATEDSILNLLQESKLIGPRVYVVHVNPDSGLKILSIAQHLQMMTDDYVWLATSWLSTALDTLESVNLNSLSYVQGLVGLRQYIPDSERKVAFMARWRYLQRKGPINSKVNAYGFYAYDTVWAIAHAIENFLIESGNVSFSSSNMLHALKGKIKLQKLRTFDGGALLLKKLLLSKFSGLSGPIQFDSDRNLVNGTYEIINVNGSTIHTVGYWHNNTGLSVSLPETVYGNKQEDLIMHQGLGSITWPSGKTETPRGWVVANSERPLRIGVPYRASYTEFVKVGKGDHSVNGYCIDVFNAMIKLIPYQVPYQFVPFGDGQSNPNYDELVRMVAEDVIDAAVGDIAIITNRARIADFTQPYISTGLVIVAPIKTIKSNAWVFLRPFTVGMWCVTGAFFFIIGVVIWMLEHRVNSDFRGSPKRQCITMFLFSFSTLFQSQQEDTLSTLGRFVMMVWLFLLMVITSSYTASLTSFLTVQQLSSPIKGIDSLIASNEPIGYQVGSFAESYLRDCLSIHPSRLVSLGSPEAYKEALNHGPKNGGVAAVVDELPYIELFLSKTSGFGIIGQPFTRSGWGFAFQRDSQLVIDMSRAILELSENGDLQMIHKKWFCKTNCAALISHDSEAERLHFSSFSGLYLVCGIATVLSLIIFLLRSIRQFKRYSRRYRDSASSADPASSAELSQRSRAIYSFFEFIDEKEEAIKSMFKRQERTCQPQNS